MARGMLGVVVLSPRGSAAAQQLPSEPLPAAYLHPNYLLRVVGREAGDVLKPP